MVAICSGYRPRRRSVPGAPWDRLCNAAPAPDIRCGVAVSLQLGLMRTRLPLLPYVARAAALSVGRASFGIGYKPLGPKNMKSTGIIPSISGTIPWALAVTTTAAGLS